MRWKIFALPFLFLLVLAVAVHARAQVTQSATQNKFPLTVGAGWSNYSLDWGPGKRADGMTVWADWRLRGMPSYLKGLSISLEGQYIGWGVPSDIGNHKQEAGLGGLSYKFGKWHRVRPYVKGLIGFGGIYFQTYDPYYTHDTRVIYAPGIGADIRAWRNLGVRVDYEYQFWPNMFGPNALNPNGVTVGAVWDFGG
jgi:Outer membrane protein beta-barrel domain